MIIFIGSWGNWNSEVRLLMSIINRARNWSSDGKESAGDLGLIRVGKIPWRRKWQPSPVFLPGIFHGQKSYSPWGCKESDTTEHAHRQRQMRLSDNGRKWKPVWNELRNEFNKVAGYKINIQKSADFYMYTHTYVCLYMCVYYIYTYKCACSVALS